MVIDGLNDNAGGSLGSNFLGAGGKGKGKGETNLHNVGANSGNVGEKEEREDTTYSTE